MVEFRRDHDAFAPARAGALAAAVAVGCALAALVPLLPIESGRAAWAVALVYAAIVCVVIIRAGTNHPYARFGAANTLTLTRAAGVAAFASLAVEPAAIDAAGAWTALAAALALLALDGVDGWVARRQGLASAFGARFDMEVDALFILVLAAVALGLGKAGPWVLGIGLARYAFVLGGRLAPWLAAPLPDSLRRKTVCVIQIATLAILLAPPMQPPLSAALPAAAFAALIWSFAIDIRGLWRRRPR